MSCGFCRNLNLPFNGHVARDCPELAKTECRYCHGLGHTVKQCPNIKHTRRQEPHRQEPHRQEPRRQEPREMKIVAPNPFSASNVEMPGEEASRLRRLEDFQPKKQFVKPLAGVWGKKNAVDLVSANKKWNLTKPSEPESEVLNAWNMRDYDSDDAPEYCQKFHTPRVMCWADDE
jgi:hypothetical protein